MKEHLRVSEAAKILGVSSKTLRRWSQSGKLVPERSTGGHRYYTYNQLRNYQLPISNLQSVSKYHLPIRKLTMIFAVSAIAGIGLFYSLKIVNCKFIDSKAGYLNCKLPARNASSIADAGGKIDNSAPAVLGASSPTFTVNIPAVFKSAVTFGKDVIIPNVIKSLTEGTGIGITSGQKPTISNTGVLSLNTSTGALSLTAGGGISVSGLSISNSDLGSSQNIFKTISVSGQSDVVSDSNTDTLTFASGTGFTLTTDATNDKLTFTLDSSALNVSGWTDANTAISNTTLTDYIGIGTTNPSYNLEISGTKYTSGAVSWGSLSNTNITTLTGTLNVNGDTTFGDSPTDIVTFNGRLATGTGLYPLTDLGASLGTSDLRFNNVYVANFNSNSGITTAGQATFTYSPPDTTFAQATVAINPTSPPANGFLLGIGVNGYQRAGIDAEGDLSLGYNNLVNIPSSDFPLSIYGHSGTSVAHIDTSGNIVTSGSLDINGTTSDIAGALNLSGNSLTSSGALTITPATGSNLNVVTTGQFAVNTSQFTVDGTTGFTGIGTASASTQLDVAGITQTDAIALSNSGTKVLGISYGTNNANINLLSSDPTNKLTNGTFESNLTSWNSTQQYNLDDQFTTSAPTTLVSGGLANPTPSFSAGDVLTNGGFEEPYTSGLANGWTNTGPSTVTEENTIIHGGTASQKIVGTNAQGVTQSTAGKLTTGNWYQASGWFYSTTENNSYFQVWDGTTVYGGMNTSFPLSTWDQRLIAFRSLNTGGYFRSLVYAGGGATIYVDDNFLKPLTLSSLFSTVVETTANKIISTGVTLTAGTQAGIVINADATFANFIIAYHDGTNIHLDKNVGGTYTSLINTAATYAADGQIKVIKLGNDYQLIYRGTKYGATTTISDAGIVAGTKQGLFSTLSTNSFTNFLITTNLDGTQAEPTGGTRTVLDSGGRWTTTGGNLSFSGGAAIFGDSSVTYPNTNRAAGKLLLSKINASGTNAFLIGFDTDTSSGIPNALQNGSSGFSIQDGANPNTQLGNISTGTDYQIAGILRTAGAYWYVKGGAYTNWTLLWISSLENTSSLYPRISGRDNAFTADNIRIPTATWLPTPLAYDTFTRADGAIGNSETTGPDSQTTPSLAWTGGAISSNKNVITPSLGSELVTNGGFDSDATGWSTINSATLTSVVGGQSGNYLEIKNGVADDGWASQNVTAVANTWYTASFYHKSGTGTGNGNGYINIGSSAAGSNYVAQTYLQNASWTQRNFSYRATAAGNYFGLHHTTTAQNDTTFLDTVSVKPLTLSSLFSTVSTSDSDVIADANVTLTAGTQAGLVLNLDSTSTPANFVIAYHDGTNVHLEKAVAGVYTSLINTAATYSAGATLRVIKDGTKYRVYYNNDLVGPEQTISDAGIISNTKHGLFSTYASNTFDNFTLWARGTGNEYAQVTPTDLTVTRDTTIKYAGSTSSAKIVAGTTDNDFTQSANVGDTSTYTLTAYVYTDGTAVTSSDLSLYYDTNILSTIYSPVGGNGWYKLTGTLTGVASSKLYGVRVKAGKTIYLDNITLTNGTASATKLYIANSGAGVAGLDVQSTSTFHSGLAGSQGLIIKGESGQTANLTDWQNISASTLTSVSSTGLLDASTGGLATLVKNGNITDTDFSDTAVNGLIGIDSTDTFQRIYFRYGGAWSYIAKSGGFQIPFDEAQGLSPGDLLIPYVESQMNDGALHGMYAKWSDVKDILFATESARIANLEMKEATTSGTLSANLLNVLGTSTLGDVTVNGQFTINNLQFTNGSLLTVDGSPISIQPLALGAINFSNNNIQIDTKGNLNIKQGLIYGNDQIRGSEILPSGSKMLDISKTWTSKPNVVLTNSSFNSKTWTDNITQNGFTLHVENSSNKNETIDWIAIW